MDSLSCVRSATETREMLYISKREEDDDPDVAPVWEQAWLSRLHR